MHDHTEPVPVAGWLERLATQSEMGRRVADFDWAATPLGPPQRWPAGLRAATEICLSTRFPMLVVWGPDLVEIYNDAYLPMLGTEKHPRALGAPARDIWPEVWDAIGPLFEQVMSTGVATWSEHQALDLERNGFLEECSFTYSYSPIPADDGTIGGVLDTVTETTQQVVNERRLACIGDLSSELVAGRQVTDVCVRAVTALSHARDDRSAVEIHLRVGEDLVLVANNHCDPADVTTAAKLGGVVAGGRPMLLDEAWEPGRPARRFALPIGDAEAGGVLVVALSSRRPFDDAYRTFLELVAATIGSALQNAYRRSVELGEQRHVSETLQNAMLVPAADIATVAARYLPAVDSLSVGGDWYDVIALPNGQRALVVGDCVGHGLAAATAMGQLRSACRALLLEGHSPSQVLSAMDLFAASVVGASCATVICVVVDCGAGTVTYSSAGHPPPLVVRPKYSAWLEEGQGAPLAVVDTERHDATATLATGDLLVLYSDGLVERRFEDLDIGLGRLRTAAEGLFEREVAAVADGILHALRDPEGRDDVALVVKRLSDLA